MSIGDYGGSERGKQLTRQIIDNFTIIRGRHTFKTNFDFGNFRMSSPPGAFGLGTGVANNAALGRFDFNGRFTNDTTGAAQPARTASPTSCWATRTSLIAPRQQR